MGRPRNTAPLHDRIVRALRASGEACEAELSRELCARIVDISCECAALHDGGYIEICHRSGKPFWQLTDKGK